MTPPPTASHLDASAAPVSFNPDVLTSDACLAGSTVFGGAPDVGRHAPLRDKDPKQCNRSAAR
jgi:hypothetical protein